MREYGWEFKKSVNDHTVSVVRCQSTGMEIWQAEFGDNWLANLGSGLLVGRDNLEFLSNA